MRPAHRHTCFATLFLAAALASFAAAETLPTLSIRYLTVEADVIIIAEPVAFDGKTLPLTYRVVKLLKGPEALAKQEIALTNDDKVYSLSPPYDFGEDKPKPLPTITRALLFLEKPEEGGTRYRPVLSGIRAQSKADGLLVPTQFMNPGPQYLIKREEPTWDAMLAQVQKDLPKIAELRELKTITDPAQRNQAILQWIASHKDEFGGSFLEEEPRGLASLEHEVFEWVFESGRPEDCWRALELSAEVDVRMDAYKAFCTPRGRELLLEKVFDKKLADKLRLKALDQLGNNGNLWYSHASPEAETVNVTAAEQRAIIQRVVPLLKHDDPHWRATAVRCLMTASGAVETSDQKRILKLATPALTALYKSEKNDEVRTQIVDALRRSESEDFWQKLTGNPHGIVVSVRLSGKEQNRLQFQLNLKHTRATLAELPQFRFEQLGKDGVPTLTVVIPPQSDYPKDAFEQGWSGGQNMIQLSVPAQELEPGKWRLTVEGKIGKDHWRSEPIEITLP